MPVPRLDLSRSPRPAHLHQNENWPRRSAWKEREEDAIHRKHRRLVFSQRWTTPLSIAYFVFYGADYFLFSRSFLAATVHLVLFAVVVRTFSLRRDRDYVMLTIVAFLMVLASAVLTVDSIFLAFFAGFMLTAVASFILMEMRRSGRAAQIQARHSHDMREHRHLAFSLARLSPALALMILMGAALIFFILPRTASGYMSTYSFGTNFSTGFSDRVRLGGIGQIQQSNAVVMHIQIDGDKRGRYALHWRGVSLAIFDGANWSNPSRQYVLPRNTDGSFSVPEFSQGMIQDSIEPIGMASREAGRVIHYRVLMEPIGTNDLSLLRGHAGSEELIGSCRSIQEERYRISTANAASASTKRIQIFLSRLQICCDEREAWFQILRRNICSCRTSTRASRNSRRRSQVLPRIITTRRLQLRNILKRIMDTRCNCCARRWLIRWQTFCSSVSKGTANILLLPWP